MNVCGSSTCQGRGSDGGRVPAWRSTLLRPRRGLMKRCSNVKGSGSDGRSLEEGRCPNLIPLFGEAHLCWKFGGKTSHIRATDLGLVEIRECRERFANLWKHGKTRSIHGS